MRSSTSHCSVMVRFSTSLCHISLLSGCWNILKSSMTTNYVWLDSAAVVLALVICTLWISKVNSTRESWYGSDSPPFFEITRIQEAPGQTILPAEEHPSTDHSDTGERALTQAQQWYYSTPNGAPQSSKCFQQEENFTVLLSCVLRSNYSSQREPTIHSHSHTAVHRWKSTDGGPMIW